MASPLTDLRPASALHNVVETVRAAAPTDVAERLQGPVEQAHDLADRIVGAAQSIDLEPLAARFPGHRPTPRHRRLPIVLAVVAIGALLIAWAVRPGNRAAEATDDESSSS